MVHGYFLAPTTLLERILLGVGAVALFIQSNAFNAAGFAILIAILFSHLKRKRSLKGSTPA
jgi:TRAP-type uncharacterized transport system fused permease subunit